MNGVKNGAHDATRQSSPPHDGAAVCVCGRSCSWWRRCSPLPSSELPSATRASSRGSSIARPNSCEARRQCPRSFRCRSRHARLLPPASPYRPRTRPSQSLKSPRAARTHPSAPVLVGAAALAETVEECHAVERKGQVAVAIRRCRNHFEVGTRRPAVRAFRLRGAD